MITIANKLLYEVVSLSSGAPQEITSDVVYKISFKTENLQIPQLRLFTHRSDLLIHLQNYGFCLKNNLLTSQAISYVGQLAANELLIRHDLQQAALSSIGDKKAECVEFIKQSYERSVEVRRIQKSLYDLQIEECAISKDDIFKQSQFKRKLTLLLQAKIYQLRVKNKNYNSIIHNLNQTINLIDNYQFDENSSDNSRNEPLCNVVYNIDPNSLGRINTHDDMLKFYLAINAFKAPQPYLKIKQQEIEQISIDRKKYHSRYSVNNLIKFIYHHPIRSIFFCWLVILECILLPNVATFLGTFKILAFFGLHNTFVITPFCISYSFYLTNLFCDTPKWLNNLYAKIWQKSSSISHDLTADNASPEEKAFKKLIDLSHVSNNPYNKSSRRKNFLLSIPVIKYAIRFLCEEYKDFSNWYFTYIQRNPIGLLFYVIIRLLNFFFRILSPISNVIYCTYFDIDRRINLDAIKAERSSPLYSGSSQLEENSVNQSKFSFKLPAVKTIISSAALIFKEACAIVLIKCPLILAFISSKIVLSFFYLALFLVFNLAIETLKLFKAEKLYGFLLNTESKITTFYYKAYYAYCYQFEFLHNCVDQLCFPEANPIYDNTIGTDNLIQGLYPKGVTAAPTEVVNCDEAGSLIPQKQVAQRKSLKVTKSTYSKS